jgi:protein O-mannosyl-transferase
MSTRRWISGACVAGAAIACYANALANGFALDDQFITNNPNDALRIGNALRLLATPYHFQAVSGLYRPVTLLSLALDRALFADAPAGFHAVNVILHAIASLLVLRLARRFLPAAAAIGAALLFAVHPVHTEAVTYVNGRADVLCALFGVAALLARPLPSAIWFFLAILSKEGAVAILPALAVMRWLEADRPPLGKLAASLAPHALALVIFFAARAAVLGSPIGLDRSAIPALDNAAAAAPALDRVATGLAVFARWVGLLVFPIALSADYSTAQIPVVGFGDPLAWLGAALVAGMAVAAWAARRREPAIAFGLSLLLLSWMPVSNVLVPIGTLLAERLLYLPSIGFCIALSPLVVRPSRAARALGVGALALLAVRTIARNADWKDDATIYAAALRVAPNAARSHALVAATSLNAVGRTTDPAAKADLLRRGEREAREALRLHPTYGKAWLYLGGILTSDGRVGEASAAYAQAERCREGVDLGDLAVGWLGLAGIERGQALAALDSGDRDRATTLALAAGDSVDHAIRVKPRDFGRADLLGSSPVPPEERAANFERAAQAFRVAGLTDPADALDRSAAQIRKAFQ